MKVELIAHTENPVELVGRAAGICWDKVSNRKSWLPAR